MRRIPKLLVLSVLGLVAGRAEATAQQPAEQILDRAIARMGGQSLLRSVRRVRFDMTTQWLHTTFDNAPYADMPGYERHTDVRDYTLGAWRNTRRFAFANAWHDVVDIVRDSVAARDVGTGLQPLNVAYVDERDELFAYTPDRLLLRMRDAGDLRVGTDTTVYGEQFARLRATVGRFPMTLLVRRGDGLPAALLFHAASPNDFGLVPWGDMEIEVWYSNWTTFPGGISLPKQWDVRRVGRPYKRVTLETATINPTFAADSFAIPADVRAGFSAAANKPMHDLPLDSARVVANDYVAFRTPGAPQGAVRVGGRWVLLEGGQAPLSAERALAWMRGHVDGDPALALLAVVLPGGGGAGVMARQGLRLMVGPGAAPFLQRVLRNRGVHAPIEVVSTGRWVGVGADSLRLEPMNLPNARGTVLAWCPTLQWLWAPDAETPLDLKVVRERVRELGWSPRWLGTRRDLRAPYEPTRPQGAASSPGLHTSGRAPTSPVGQKRPAITPRRGDEKRSATLWTVHGEPHAYSGWRRALALSPPWGRATDRPEFFRYPRHVSTGAKETAHRMPRGRSCARSRSPSGSPHRG